MAFLNTHIFLVFVDLDVCSKVVLFGQPFYLLIISA